MNLQLLPMAMGWWVYGISGVIALKYLNVPMFRYNVSSASLEVRTDFASFPTSRTRKALWDQSTLNHFALIFAQSISEFQ